MAWKGSIQLEPEAFSDKAAGAGALVGALVGAGVDIGVSAEGVEDERVSVQGHEWTQ
jgi:hypothetical protein